MNLRDQLIRLAFENKNLRKDLLPLLKEAAEEVDLQKQLKVDADPKSKDENKPSEWYGLAPKGIQAGGKTARASREALAEPDLALAALNALADEAGLPVRFRDVNQTIIPVPVPNGFDSLFKEIEIEVQWKDWWGRVGWSYKHPRASNGYGIGSVSKDPKTGRWGWQTESGRHGFVS